MQSFLQKTLTIGEAKTLFLSVRAIDKNFILMVSLFYYVQLSFWVLLIIDRGREEKRKSTASQSHLIQTHILLITRPAHYHSSTIAVLFQVSLKGTT